MSYAYVSMLCKIYIVFEEVYSDNLPSGRFQALFSNQNPKILMEWSYYNRGTLPIKPWACTFKRTCTNGHLYNSVSIGHLYNDHFF